MAKKTTPVSYNEDDDLLFIHKEGAVKGNLELGGFILDVSTTGHVIGIEILEASQKLKLFGITKRILKNVQHAQLITQTQPDNTLFVGFKLFSTIPTGNGKSELTEKQAMVAVPAVS